jgi:hypothetical protein
LPAVSGSSGWLIISPLKENTAEHTWSGEVFEDRTLDYAAAMHAFVAASLPDAQPATPTDTPVQAEKASCREQKRKLRRETLALRDARRNTRTRCKTEDVACRTLWQQRRDAAIADETWQRLRTQRTAELEQRQPADVT